MPVASMFNNVLTEYAVSCVIQPMSKAMLILYGQAMNGRAALSMEDQNNDVLSP